MPKYDVPDTTPHEEIQFKPDRIKYADCWSSDEFDRWIASSSLADWAKEWMSSLKPKYTDYLAELMYNGFGNSKNMPDWLKTGKPDAVWLRNFISKSDTAIDWFQNGFLTEDPNWLRKLISCEKAKVARSFLLSGNISDYAFDPVHGYRHAIRILVDTLMREKDCVLTYRLSQGLMLQPDNDEIRKKLPEAIRSELDSEGFHRDTPLIAQICQLFDSLSNWLTGRKTDLNCDDFPKGIAIVFENVHLIISSSPTDIERNYIIDNLLHWSNSPELFRSRHCLILMAESLEDVANELRVRGGKIEQIAIPRPENAKTRFKFLLPLLDPRSTMTGTRVSRISSGLSGLEGYHGTYLERIEQLSNDTAGLTLIGIEDLVQGALNGPSRTISRETVMALKRERLRQESEGILEVIDPRRKLDDIGGYRFLKNRLKEIINSLLHPSNEFVRSSIPMGILLLGPPGTGKSIIAESLAGESNISMAKLGDFRGMYVGQSERNLTRIFSLIESLHPVIVFIDEIDQALGKRGATSGVGGVDNRIFGRFLEFMSNTDHRGKILWVGASNFPDKIDPAMKRAGRFDLILPVLLPDDDSRQHILKILLHAVIRDSDNIQNSLKESDYKRLSELTADFSGAELQAIVGEVIRRVVKEMLQTNEWMSIDIHLFEKVLEVYKPPVERRHEYQKMETIAIKEVSFIDMLPEKYQHIRLQQKNRKNV